MAEAEIATVAAEPLAYEQTVLPGQFIWKVNSRCNLACDYCYVYEMADQSWENQPIRMSSEIVDAASYRIGEYAQQHKLNSVAVGFHGGEPLLAGPDFFADSCKTIRQALPNTTAVNFFMQTNGALLNQEFMDVFQRWGVRVGVSLDGDRDANDLHRRYRNGRSSYDNVMQGLDLLRSDANRHLFAGILAVVDIRNDPTKVYEAIREIEPPNVDFLLPHGTWDTPPYGLEDADKRSQAPYAAWLRPIFDTWLKKDIDTINVRTFRSVLDLLAGGTSRVETLGGTSLNEVVIETDGSYQKVDTLKATYAGAPEIGMNVQQHSVAEAVTQAQNQMQKMGAFALSEICQVCPVSKVCGSGYVPHRFSEQTGYANPSVYHEDLLQFIAHAKGAAVEQTIVLAAQRLLAPFVERGFAH